MRDVSVCLDGEKEVFRGNFIPVFECLLLRQMIEGVVDFDGIEMLGVIFEPLALGQISRIEPSAPVVVIPPRCTYSNIAFRLAHRTYFNNFMRFMELPC